MSESAGRRPFSRRGALLLYCIAAVGLPLSSFIASAVITLVGIENIYVSQLVCDCLYYIPFIVTPVLIFLRRRPGSCENCRPGGIAVSRALLICLLAVNVFILCNDLTVLWAIPFQKLGLNIYAGSYAAPSGTGELMLYVVSAAVLPAICEEVLFRGILLRAFEPTGTKRAILLTSIMFALLHGSPIGLPAELLAGIVLACVTVICDSIYAGIIFHTVYNTVSVIIEYLQQSESSGDLLGSIGGVSGIFSLAFDCLLFFACICFLIRAMFARARYDGITIYPNTGSERLQPRELTCVFVAGAAIILAYALNIFSML